MKKVWIIGDSTCDLPLEWREKLDVPMMPLPVNVGSEARLDMLDVFPEEIFDYFEKTGTLCTTSAPNAISYVDFWTDIRKQDPDCEILHFHISAEMTNTHFASCEAAAQFDGIWSIDTRSVSIGVALLIMEACRLRDLGHSGQEIFDAIERIKSRVSVGFVIDSVEYLHKGGRCTGLQALGANLLALHPAINMTDGALRPGKKYRGAMKNVYESLIRDMVGNVSIAIENERIFVANTSFDAEMNDYLAQAIRKVRPSVREIIFSQPGCSICVHCGPHTVGIAFLEQEASV